MKIEGPAFQNNQGNIVIPAPINGGTEWGVFEILPTNTFLRIEDKSLPLRSWRFEVARDLARYAKKQKWVPVEVHHRSND
ncbi:MAG: hypothetical protein ACD_74C00158G0013 [uncultured bacterium]|nr:MAG: hypothetical protein ACD_74C00158G0013 [uncultured bacterium]